MEKSERLKAVGAVAESLGLTAKEVIAYFGKASVQFEEAASVNVVCPGMYYYSDGTISAEVLSEKQISGVVGWVDDSGRHGLVLGLREVRLPWFASLKWCTKYAFDGIYGALSPTREGLVEIFKNLDAIQKALWQINMPLLRNSWYWSGTEYNDDHAWRVSPSDITMYGSYSSQANSNLVRCVFAF